jgi:hypothetical protein
MAKVFAKIIYGLATLEAMALARLKGSERRLAGRCDSAGVAQMVTTDWWAMTTMENRTGLVRVSVLWRAPGNY